MILSSEIHFQLVIHDWGGRLAWAFKNKLFDSKRLLINNLQNTKCCLLLSSHHLQQIRVSTIHRMSALSWTLVPILSTPCSLNFLDGLYSVHVICWSYCAHLIWIILRNDLQDFISLTSVTLPTMQKDRDTLSPLKNKLGEVNLGRMNSILNKYCLSGKLPVLSNLVQLSGLDG